MKFTYNNPMGRRRLYVAWLMALTFGAAHAAIIPWTQTFLWQEQFFWDALMEARSRAARQQADPNLLPVMRLIATQAAQQAANLQQIQAYTKSQEDNLRFAFSQKDPGPSLATIRTNLETLAKGADQIRNNLYYLTARCRMASSQALPDPELTKIAASLIAQIQAVQLNLNSLYANATAVQSQVAAEAWPRDNTLRYDADNLVRSSVQIQNAVFLVYNASYEIYLRSR